MKICYIISDIDKAVYFEQTALSLREKKIDVTYILINCSNKELHVFLKKHQFEVFTLEANSLLKSRKSIVACKAILNQLQIELVHCHLAQANWIGLWAAKLSGIKQRIFTRHSGEPLKIHWKERIIDWIQNRLATKIVAISKTIDDLLVSQGVPNSKRVLIHHGFNLERFSNPNPEEVSRIKQQYNHNQQYPVIGVIARWIEWKGIQHIIDAFEQLLNNYPNARLCLFGYSTNTDYHDVLMERINKLVSSSYEIVAFEPNVSDLYQLFDVYVHVPINPSCEAFGQTYVEALAARVPSIFTLSGIAREFIVNEKNALVVPFEDSEAIENSIIRLLEDKELREKLSANGLKSVNQLFRFETYIQQLKKLYSN